MDRHEHLQHTLAFNSWANGQSAAALCGLHDPPPRAVRICAHIAGAEQLWLSRLKRTQTPDVWPELNASQCAAAMAQLAEAWRDWVVSVEEISLDVPIDYINSKGEPWASTMAEIITHVTHHASYHRGQIAVLMAAAGHEAPYVDYIHAMRQGFI